MDINGDALEVLFSEISLVSPNMGQAHVLVGC